MNRNICGSFETLTLTAKTNYIQERRVLFIQIINN